MKFTIPDIQQMTDPGSFQRGVAYFKQGRVRNLQYQPGDTTFVAKVAGSGRQLYVARVFWVDDYLGGTCSCPVQFDCKHCVAAALQWQLDFGGAQSPAETKPPAASPLKQWLARIPKSRPSASGPLTFGQSYVLYFLEKRGGLEMRRGQFNIVPHKGYLKKNGEWSRITRYNPDYFGLKYTPPAHVRPEDVTILQLLPLDSGRDGVELVGEAGRLALGQMLASGRLAFEGRMVRSAKSETLRWQWTEDDRGYQLQGEILGRKNWQILETAPPCYLDTDEVCIGELIAPMDSAQLAHLLAIPPVQTTEIGEVALALRQHFTQEQLTLPVAEPKIVTADTPAPVITLVSAQVFAHSNLPALLVHFEYGGQKVTPHYSLAPLEATEYREVDGTQFHIRRNLDKETAWLEELLELGLYSFEEIGQHRDAWAPEPAEPKELIPFWLNFVDKELPKLEQQGWEIRTDPEFSLEVSEARFDFALKDAPNHWFEFALTLPISDQMKLNTAEVVDLWLKQGAPDELVVEVEGEWIRINTQPLNSIRDLITDLYNRKKLNKPIKLPAFQVAQLQALPDLDQRKAPLTQKLFKQLQDFRGIEPVTPSKHLQAELRPYQQEGFNWLAFLQHYRLGGILADDMGLGKTLQTLALLQHLKDSGSLTKPALIVAPTSLTGNWLHEAERFTPDLKLTLIHGPERAPAFKQMAKSDLVITTYPLLLRDSKRYEKHSFSVLILDEAQAIKNPTTKIAQLVRSLNSATRLCLTGTPLENHLGELWSLMDFVLPGLLSGRSQFQQQFRSPIENEGNAQRQQELARRVAPFMLRRTKSQVVKELPAKTEILQYVELQGQQRALYESIRVSMEKRIRDLVAQQGMERSHIQFLDALLKLRQACIDPRLVKLDKAANIKEHAKLDWLNENLPQLLEEGRNILIFSQFTQLLALIETELKAQNISYSKLTGQTRHRQRAIDRFQSGEARIFLISLKAGGSGLNLTAADVVIHMDPWWNPAVENQATDRAHRIGQDKPVFVYKLVAAETVEERIQQMQQQKQALADNLFDESSAAGSSADKEVLLDLLST